jgi:hypothetical protein
MVLSSATRVAHDRLDVSHASECERDVTGTYGLVVEFGL